MCTLLGASRTAFLLAPIGRASRLLEPALGLVGRDIVLRLIGVSRGLLVVSVLALRRKWGKLPLRLSLLTLFTTGVEGVALGVVGLVVALLVGVVGVVDVVGLLPMSRSGVDGRVVDVVASLVLEDVELPPGALAPPPPALPPASRVVLALFLYSRVDGLIARFVGRDVSRVAALKLFIVTVSVTIVEVITRFVVWCAPPPGAFALPRSTLSVSFLSRTSMWFTVVKSVLNVTHMLTAHI